MVKLFTIGIGAGLVSALLVMVVVKATTLALVLYFLAPIPILIAALAWDQRAGLVAAITGALALMVATSSIRSGVGFAIGTALPSWWLGYLALLGRPTPDGTLEWYPLGRLLGWIAATAAVSLTAAAVLSTDGYEGFQQNSQVAGEAIVGMLLGPGSPEASQFDPAQREQLTLAVAARLPLIAALVITLFLGFYLWAAAKVVAVSGRLPRPWPFIPGVMMPRRMLGVLALAVALAFFGGFAGVFGLALIGGLVTAFGLQGLASLHARTAGKPARLPLLIVTYLVMLLSQGALLVAFTVLGMTETALNRRRIQSSGGAGPQSPT
jgi:hypothetical protein